MSRKCLFPLLLLCHCAAVDLMANLPRIYSTEDEVFSIRLSDYFEGNNVNFTILEGSKLDAFVDDPFNISLAYKFSYRMPNKPSPLRGYGVQMLSLASSGETYIISAYNNVLQAFLLSSLGEVDQQWEFAIPSDSPSACILRLREVWSEDSSDVLILMSTNQTVNSQPTLRFDMYAVDLTNPAVAPIRIQHLNMSEIQYATKVDFACVSSGANTSFQVAAVSCTQPDGTSAILIYNIADFDKVELMQEITAYHNVAGNPGAVPLNTVDMTVFDGQLFVLDRKAGLFSFAFLNEFFTCNSYTDVLRFGTPVSISAPVSSGRYLVVGTSSVLLLLDVDANSYLEHKWIPSVLGNGRPWAPLSSISNDRYILANAQQDSIHSLLVIDYRDTFGSSIKRQWKFSKLIPNSVFLPNGMCLMQQLLDPETFFLFRSDADALRVFNITVGEWSLQGTANAAGPYSATVLALNLDNPLDTAISTLHVDYIELTNYTIFYGSGYTLSTTPPGMTLQPDIIGTRAIAEIPISSMFSGPDVAVSLEFTNVSQGLHLSYSPTYNRTVLEYSATTANFTIDADFFAMFCGIDLVLVSEKGAIVVYSLPYFAVISKFDLENYQPLSVTTDYSENIYVLGKPDKENAVILTYSVYNGTLVQPPMIPPQACFALKCGLNYLFCLAQSQVVIYWMTSGESLQLYTVLTPARLRLPSLALVDLDVDFDPNTAKTILFLSCSINGLLAVDISNVLFVSITVPVISAMSSATNGVYLAIAESVLVQGNADGSIFIFDISCSPDITLVRTLPAWSSAAPVSFMRLSGLLAAFTGEELLFYDVQDSVHNSLYLAMQVEEGCKVVATALFAQTFCGSGDTVAISVYSFYEGESTSTGFQYSYNVDISIDPNDSPQDFYQVNGTVKAVNRFGGSAEESISLNIQSQGHVVIQDSSYNLPANISYNESQSFSTASIFSGQNLDLFLNINGEYPLYTANNTLPAVIFPPVQLTNYYDFDEETTNICDSVIINDTYLLVLRDSQLLVFNISATDENNWFEGSNSSLLLSMDYCEVVDSELVTGCQLVTLLTYINNKALLALSCSGYSAFTIGDSGRAGFNILYLVYFNPQNLTFAVAYSTVLTFAPVIMKGKVSPNSNIFLILVDGMHFSDKQSNNHLTWYNMMLMQSGSIAVYAKPQVVDFYSLQLNSLCIADAELLLVGNDAGAVYIADACFGVRAIAISGDTGRVTLVTGAAVEDGRVVGVSVCGAMLYALTDTTSLLFFNISTQFNLQSSRVYVHRYDTARSVFGSISASLQCSSRSSQGGDFLAALLEDDESNRVVRVVDISADSDSAILRDILLVNSSLVSLAFNDNCILAAHKSWEIQAWQLRHPALTFPSMTLDQYQAMLSHWGTPNFTVLITAANDQMVLNSTQRQVSRVPVSEDIRDDSSNGNTASQYWWVWLLVAIVVVLGFVGVSLALRIYHKRKEARANLHSVPPSSFHSFPNIN